MEKQTEAKMMEMLAQLVEGQSQMGQQISTLTDKVTGIKTRLDNEINPRLNMLSDEVKGIKLTLENETNVYVRFLFEAREVQKDVNERILAS